jgi:hypothetical protein
MAMTTSIIGVAIFYALAIAYIGFEMWRAPLVDDNGNVLSQNNTLQEALYITRIG